LLQLDSYSASRLDSARSRVTRLLVVAHRYSLGLARRMVPLRVVLAIRPVLDERTQDSEAAAA
jgi:hypothetical protein